MGEQTAIEWCDHTFNPWWGCVKVSEACRNCYALAWSKRTGHDVWGVDRPRRLFGDKHWAEPLKWNKAAEKAGVRRRVFCASMADVGEDRVDLDPLRARLFRLVLDTPWLDWLFLTKRPETWMELLRRALPFCDDGTRAMVQAWIDGKPPRNVWMGTTAEDERNARDRVHHLRRIPAAIRFVSAEPLLGALDHHSLALGGSTTHHMALDIRGALRNRHFDGFEHADGRPMSRSDAEDALFDLHAQGMRLMPMGPCDDFDHETGCRGHPVPGIDWVIVGGESGPGARPMDPNAARAIRDACARAGVPFLFKQWGDHNETGRRVGKKLAGRLLDGRTHDEFPTPPAAPYREERRGE